MIGPNNGLPQNYFDQSGTLSSSQFTRNLYDLKYRGNGTGRDSYIYENNGGFSTKIINHSPKHGTTAMLPSLKV